MNDNDVVIRMVNDLSGSDNIETTISEFFDTEFDYDEIWRTWMRFFKENVSESLENLRIILIWYVLRSTKPIPLDIARVPNAQPLIKALTYFKISPCSNFEENIRLRKNQLSVARLGHLFADVVLKLRALLIHHSVIDSAPGDIGKLPLLFAWPEGIYFTHFNKYNQLFQDWFNECKKISRMQYRRIETDLSNNDEDYIGVYEHPKINQLVAVTVIQEAQYLQDGRLFMSNQVRERLRKALNDPTYFDVMRYTNEIFNIGFWPDIVSIANDLRYVEFNYCACYFKCIELLKVNPSKFAKNLRSILIISILREDRLMRIDAGKMLGIEEIRIALEYFKIDLTAEIDALRRLESDSLSLLRLSLLFPTLIISFRKSLLKIGLLHNEFSNEYQTSVYETWPGGILFVKNTKEDFEKWFLWFRKFRNRCMDTSILNYQDFEDIEVFFELIYDSQRPEIVSYIKFICRELIDLESINKFSFHELVSDEESD
jgi:hypothetical protein